MKLQLFSPDSVQIIEEKSQLIEVSSYFCSLEIEDEQNELKKVFVGQEELTFSKTGSIKIPCTMTAQNHQIIQLYTKKKRINLAMKYAPKLLIDSDVLEAYADFHRELGSWLEGGKKSFSDVVKSIQTGELSLLRMLNPLTGMDDLALLDDISKVLPFALEICAKPRQHLRLEEEILDVSLVKRISPSTLQHLAAHSEHWQSRTVTGLIPARLKADVYEDELEIYENIFFRMAIDKIQRFVAQKGAQVREAIEQKDDVTNWAFYASEMNDYRRMAMLRQLMPTVDIEKSEVEKREFLSLLNKIRKIERQLSSITSSPMYRKLNRAKQLPLPIQPTNILNMDARYHVIYRLWNQLINQAQLKNQEELTGSTVNDINIYYEAYVLISLIYATHLNGLQSADDAVIWMDEGQLCYIFNVEDDRFYLDGVAEGTVQKRIQFTLREKLHQVMPVEDKVIPLVEEELRYSHENKALIFHNKPEAEEEKALQQLVKRYIQGNKISGTALREWNALEVQWRERLTAFLQQLPENGTTTMSMYSILGQIGQSIKDVEETTNDLLTNSKRLAPALVLMPIALRDYREWTDERLLRRMNTIGEAFHPQDAEFGGYQTGILSVSQVDLLSVQRLMKALFTFVERQQVKWAITPKTCPSCSSSNIEKQDDSWNCREFDCQFIWGQTKCSTGCGKMYEWMRPQIKLKNKQFETFYDLQRYKESIFGTHICTDFQITSKSEVLMYSPVCPYCGK